MDAPGSPPPELIRSVLEMRETIGVDAARQVLRAGERRRARPAPRELAEDAAAALDADGKDSPEALVAFIALWQAIVDGSGNLAYRLGLNSLNAALGVYPDLAGALIPSDPPSCARSARPSRRRAMPRGRRRSAPARCLALPPQLV